jgi:hypothetical protein
MHALLITVRQKPSVGDWGFPLFNDDDRGLVRDRDIGDFPTMGMGPGEHLVVRQAGFT